jgi:branched-chain amino acid transport system permease protein
MSAARLRSPTSLATSALVPLGLLGFAVAIGAAGTPAFEATVTLTLCTLVIVCGLQIFIGNSGVYSFGQLGFAAAGAYAAALLTLPAAFTALQTPALPHLIASAQIDPLSATLIAGLGAALLAAVVGLPLMRTSTLAIPISTFAFLIVIYTVLANWDPVTGGASGLVSIPRSTTVVTAGLWAGASVLVALAYRFSSGGYRLLATREDEVAARSLGIAVTKERLLAFTLSALLCGIGGALTVQQSGVLDPATFYFAPSVTTLAMLVVGGARSVLGAVIGTFALASVNELLRGLEGGGSVFGLSLGTAPGLGAIGVGAILLATMIARPDGLTGGREAGELLARLRRRSPRPAPRTSLGEPESPPEGAGLRAEGIVVGFGGLEVLRGVDLELAPGEALGLIGPNGAGKTTLVNVLSGFQAPTAGTLNIDGTALSGASPARLARGGLARSFQAALPFPHLSVLESVAIGAMGAGVPKRRAVETAAALLVRFELAGDAERPAGSLTAARQRLLGVSRALATGPRYLLLDEPAAGLDRDEREELVAMLRSVLTDFGCGILLIEHEMSVVMELCHRVQVLDDGQTIRVGAPAQIQTDPAVLEAYLGSAYVEGAGA